MNGLTNDDFPRGAGDPDFYGYPGQEEYEKQQAALAESKRDAKECQEADEYQQDGQS